MADVAVPVPFQLTQGATVGLIILQGASPLNTAANHQINGYQVPTVSAASIMTTSCTTNHNNNNNNTLTKNNNTIKETSQKYQKPIKPAPAKGASKKASKRTSTGTTPPLKPPKKLRDEDNEILRCKRRLDFAKLGLPFNRANPVAVARRNERERKRVKQINSTFLSLRDHLPTSYCPHKNPNKMSKVETLRGAIDYINSLQDLVDNYDTVHSALASGGYAESPSSEQHQPQQQQQAHQQQKQSQQQSQQQQQHELYPKADMCTVDMLNSVNQMLSVQPASNVPHTLAMTSPTGSTCSSVCSSSSGATCTPGTGNVNPTDFLSMLYPSNHQDMMYHQHIPDSHPPLDIKEEDLLEFAQAWF